MVKHFYSCLVNCNLGDEGATAIGSKISKSSTIKTLLIKSNLIGDSGAFSIANGIASPMCGLTKLDLSTNKINDQGGNSLIKGLELNRRLQNVNLRANFLVRSDHKHTG